MTTDRSISSTLVSLLLLLCPATGFAVSGHHHPDALAPVLRATPGLPQGEAEPVVEVGAEEKAAAGEDQAESWDVTEPHGPSHTVTIDTTSGTWLNLDVSPDGSEIAFDLLGDLYAIPIDGGEATALTEGLEWDMQPTYSPDGSTIAFTSDRGGGDNVWIMGRDGSDPQAVTDESFRLLNSPAWSPDGEYLAARKHYTGTRSLGAGEIWIYHRSGGAGLQMTERPDQQKDVGEPAFSPDGRYVYYSRDATPGPVFEYNKDPNAGIYSIFRLDRHDRRDRRAGLRPRRRGPADAVAGRRVARLRPPGAREDRALGARPGLRRRAAALRRPRPGHAGDLGDPRRLSAHGLDPRLRLDRLLGRRRHPPDRRRRRRGHRRPVPRPGRARPWSTRCASRSRWRPSASRSR